MTRKPLDVRDNTSEAAMTADQITEAQRRLGRLGPGSLSLTFWERWARIHSKDKRRPVHARRELRRRARWWELEAMRGGPSSERARQNAANLRWLVELMDNGHRVDGVTFEELVRLHGGRAVKRSIKRAEPPVDIDSLVDEIRRLGRIAGGYAIVELDLRAHGIPPGIVGEQANRVAREFKQAKEALSAAQAKCSHAFERIEARPPFERCARCYVTRAIQ